MKKIFTGLLLGLVVILMFGQVANAAQWKFTPSSVNGWLTVWGTINCSTVGSPLFGRSYVVKDQEYSGWLPIWCNDYLTKFEWDAACGNVDWHKTAVPYWSADHWELNPLDDWMMANLPGDTILPSIGDPSGVIQTIYLVVNLEAWLASPQPLLPSYDIIGGICPDLPGFLIGTSEIIFNPGAGPMDNPFETTPLTGTLYLDGEVTFSPLAAPPVPAMNQWGLIALIVLLMIGGAVVIKNRKQSGLLD